MAKLTKRSEDSGNTLFSQFKKRYAKAEATLERVQDFSHGVGSRGTALESNIINTVDIRNQLADSGYSEDEIANATAMPPSLWGQQAYGGGVVPHSEVLRRWETPEHAPPNTGFMGATKASKERMFNARMGEIESFHSLAGIKLGRSNPINWMVNRRKKLFNPNARAWYGRGGHSLELIQEASDQTSLPYSRMRRVVSINSPRHLWDALPKTGPRAGTLTYPNVETAVGVTQAVQRSLQEFPDDYDRALNAAEHARTPFGAKSGGYPSRRRASAPVVWGAGHMSDPIVSELHKVPSFDVALSNPTSDTYGFSPHVARHLARSHVADTWDASGMGINEKMVSRKVNGKNKKYGAISGVEDGFAATFLEKPSGYDVATATAKIAAAELFNDHYKQQHQIGGKAHADLWAQANAWRYEPVHFQSGIWDQAREQKLKTIKKK